MIIQRQNYLPVILKSIAVLAVIALYTFFDARSPGSFFPQCPFHVLTGLYCPGCGSQRALSALLHGHFIDGMHDNFLAMLSLPVLVFSASVYSLNFFREKKLKQSIFYKTWFVWLVLASVIIFTILRNIPVFPFSMLAPLQ
ncbi:MAG: DUF2752 domain-containing protein [Chitinophagaceae bacterium]